MDWEQQQPAAATAAGPADDSTTQAAPGSRKRGRQQQSGSNVRRVARRRSAATADAAAMPAGAACGRRQSRGRQKVVIEELPGGIIQSSADVLVKTKGDIRLPKAFVKRCFPQLPCELPLRLEMAPAAAGAGVASERPAGALADTTIKLRPYTYSNGQSCTCSPAAAGLGSYHGFKIIAWQAKPNSSGSNSSRLTVLLQSPAAQQAVAAAASAAAAEAAAAVDSAAAGGGENGRGHVWHTHTLMPAKKVTWSNLICPSQLVAAAFLPHHPAGTRSLQLQLSVFKDGQPVSTAAGGGWQMALTFTGSHNCSFRFPAVVMSRLAGCELQLMRAAAPNLLQVLVVNDSTHRPAPSEAAVAAAGANPSAATAASRGWTPGSSGKAAAAEHNTPPPPPSPTAAAPATSAAAAEAFRPGQQKQPQQGRQLRQHHQQAIPPGSSGPASAAAALRELPTPATRRAEGSRNTSAGTEQHASRSHQQQQQQSSVAAGGLPRSASGAGMGTREGGRLATAGRSRLVLPVKAEPDVRRPAAMAAAAASDTAATGRISDMAAAVAQPAGRGSPPNLAQLPAGYELPPVDSAAAGMQQLLGLLQLLQADPALLAKFTAKLGRLQQAPVGDRQLHWFSVSYEMVRTWLQQGRLDMVVQSLEVALA